MVVMADMMGRGLLWEVRAWTYEAHLDEASFLYEQRLRYLDDPGVTLDEVAALEARQEAHLDGLVLGEAQAGGLCVEQLTGDDPGAIHTAVRVLCRQGQRQAVGQALQPLAAHDASEVPTALTSALCLDCPETWSPLAAAALEHGDIALLAVWARVIGYRLWPLGARLALAASHVGPRDAPALLACAWALGELREVSAVSWLRELLRADNPDVGRTAAIALIKCGAPQTRPDIDALCGGLPGWSAIPLALAGAATARQLESIAAQTKDPHAADGLIAIGVCGDGASLPLLLSQLTDARLGPSAAIALHLLLGVACMDEVEVPASKDETLDDDLADPDGGAANASAADSAEDTPAETAVRPTTAMQLSRDPARWLPCVDARPDLQVARVPIRMGARAGFDSTAAALRSMALPLRVRAMLADELRMRIDTTTAYRVDAEVPQQRRALAALAASVDRSHDESGSSTGGRRG